MKILRFALISFFILFCLLNASGSFGFEAGSVRAGYMGELVGRIQKGELLSLQLLM